MKAQYCLFYSQILKKPSEVTSVIAKVCVFLHENATTLKKKNKGDLAIAGDESFLTIQLSATRNALCSQFLLVCESSQGGTMISANESPFPRLALQCFLREHRPTWCSSDILHTAFPGSLLLSPACFIFDCSANLHVQPMLSCET